MNEYFLQFIWKNHLFRDKFGRASTGEIIEIVDVGEQNTDSGPDFLNARIRIGQTLWVGNVEVHLSSSDWYRHRHHQDPAYDNVILGVVLNHDREVVRTDGQVIPSLVLDFDRALLEKYMALMGNRKWIACENFFAGVDSLIVDLWLNKLLVERLERKSAVIRVSLDQQMMDWDEVFYQKLARSFGYKINADPFEQLARLCPWKLVSKHRDNLFQVEALLFGQAGFLGQEPVDRYHSGLQEEYRFLSSKYSLQSMKIFQWKHLRLRPMNFPALRIAQFAAMIHQADTWFDNFTRQAGPQQMQKFLDAAPSLYWKKNYSFGIPAGKPMTGIGEDMRNIIVINVIVPFVYLYAQMNGTVGLREQALDWLTGLPPENNSTIRKWRERGMEIGSAFSSQAALQLRNEYCHYRRCLKCQVGKHIISVTDA